MPVVSWTHHAEVSPEEISNRLQFAASRYQYAFRNEFDDVLNLFLPLRDQLLFAGLWKRFHFVYDLNEGDLTFSTQTEQGKQVYVDFALSTTAMESWPTSIRVRIGHDFVCRTTDPNTAFYLLQRILPSTGA